jgi:hypothetical protein
MAIEGIDYQFVRSDESTSSPTACELLEVTTALACAAGDPNLAVQVKTGIGRFFADLKKTPYKTLFNPSLSGAKAFNATIANRAIEKWIEMKKKTAKRSGPAWGALVHGNRILSSVVFSKYGAAKLSQSIKDFSTTFKYSDIEPLCEDAYNKMVAGINTHYQGKFLAVLFKNPSISKHVFDLAGA